MSEKKLVIAVTEEEIKAAIVAKANEYKEIFTGSKLIIISELSGVFVFLADFIRELPLDVLKGNSLSRLYEVVNEGEPRTVKVLSLVNRKNEEKNKDVEVESLFDLGDEKIVGYGMADHENFRGLKALYYLEESE
jgi:hypoxanthine-guanine phosphoribosyltransferase